MIGKRGGKSKGAEVKRVRLECPGKRGRN